MTPTVSAALTNNFFTHQSVNTQLKFDTINDSPNVFDSKTLCMVLDFNRGNIS